MRARAAPAPATQLTHTTSSGLLRAARSTLSDAGAPTRTAAPAGASFSFEAAGVRLEAAGVSVLRRDVAAVHAFVAGVA